MDILIFNWKDIRHPDAGGAEVYTHELAKRIVKNGHNVTIFTSKFPGALNKEEIDGITIIRSGKIYSVFDNVFSNAKRFYQDHKNDFDVIVDEINTCPFFTPKYVRKPIVAIIHQLAKEFWDYKFKKPLSLFGKYFLEPYWLSLYRNIKTITVSESTKKDLKMFGFKNVEIIYNGINIRPLDTVPKKADNFTVLFVGRLSPTKKPEDAIKSYLLLNKGLFIIVGRGELLPKLIKKYYRFKDKIVFRGFVTECKKIELMKKAHVLLVPGIREGWGRVVIEANALGTPAIGYNIPGLRDSIKNGYNGILCNPNYRSMYYSLYYLYNHQEILYKLSVNSLKWAKKFSWKKSAQAFKKVLEEVSKQ